MGTPRENGNSSLLYFRTCLVIHNVHSTNNIYTYITRIVFDKVTALLLYLYTNRRAT